MYSITYVYTYSTCISHVSYSLYLYRRYIMPMYLNTHAPTYFSVKNYTIDNAYSHIVLLLIYYLHIHTLSYIYFYNPIHIHLLIYYTCSYTNLHILLYIHLYIHAHVGEDQTPPWVTELLNSGMLLEVHKFSKFIHGCAVLLPDEVCMSSVYILL